jgi:flavin-dependent dehydrogenase
MTDTRILVVGAGIAGLAVARTLARAGVEVETVERTSAWESVFSRTTGGVRVRTCV